MIINFEEITFELTDIEVETTLPKVVEILSSATNLQRAITNEKIIFLLKQQDIKCSSPRIRKIIHEIRIHHLVPHLIATSKGYYITSDIEEVRKYIVSLQQRIRSITEIITALETELS